MPGKYGVTRHDADTLRLVTLDQESRIIGVLRRVADRAGGTLGWRLDAKVVLNGPTRKVWPAPEDALVATKLMSKREAKQAIAAANPASSGGGAPC